MIYDRDEDLSSARDLVDLFLDNPLFSIDHIFDATAVGLVGFVFRGQSDKSWKLLPTAHRSGDPLKEFTPQSPGALDKGSLDLRRYLELHLHAEMRAVHGGNSKECVNVSQVAYPLG